MVRGSKQTFSQSAKITTETRAPEPERGPPSLTQNSSPGLSSLQGLFRGLRPSDQVPGARSPPSPATGEHPAPRPAAGKPVTRQQSPGPETWEAYPGRESFPIPSVLASEVPAEHRGWAAAHFLPFPPGRAVLGLVSPTPPKTCWLLLVSVGSRSLRPAYSIASCIRAASKAEAGGGKGERRGGPGEEE